LAPSRCRLQLTVPCDMYDRTYDAAREQRVTVPEVIRRAIAKMLADERGTTLSV
jgi:hypothetical protein